MYCVKVLELRRDYIVRASMRARLPWNPTLSTGCIVVHGTFTILRPFACMWNLPLVKTNVFELESVRGQHINLLKKHSD